MNLYCCTIDLKDDAKALAFAHALDEWMGLLMERKVILDWQLYRRKLNLADGLYRDFMLQIAVKDLAQLDAAFRVSGEDDDAISTRYRSVHGLIKHVDFGLYRPFPDPERVERMGLL
ncbi:DUF6614 family protein [Mesobacterium pallidum]|uniref:DUF6614 family protein n=1 Tax=Mesobacterium pallidum TaxID=2872037 RepID=UPI001EE22AB1|nr:DUF6614 family protein [Mesobacterium pallidum]